MSENVKAEIEARAEVDEWKKVRDFLKKQFDSLKIEDEKYKKNMILVCEEIFSNIINHAYADKKGRISISVGKERQTQIEKEVEMLSIVFKDKGIKFNPLQSKPGKISGKAIERKIGGMGLHMAKSMVDEIEYQNINGENVLKLTKML
mgnify:FL=1